MQRSNFYTGFFFLVFGLVLYFILIPYQVELGDDADGLSPRFFPNLGAIGLSVTGLILFLTSWRQIKQLVASPDINGEEKQKRSKENNKDDHLTLKNALHLLLFVAVLSMNVFIIGMAGFMIGAPLTVISFMLLNGGKIGPIGIILTAGIGTTVIYILAWGIFEIPLP